MTKALSVHKIGGSCLKELNNTKQLLQYITNLPGKKFIVFSAPYGVTDILHQVLQIDKDPDLFLNKIYRIYTNFIELSPPKQFLDLFEELTTTVHALFKLQITSDLMIDKTLSFGERMIIPIMEDLLSNMGVSSYSLFAEKIFCTTSKFYQSDVNVDLSKLKAQNHEEYLTNYKTILFPGYYGLGEDNEIHLLGRSGSDYSAAVLANIFNAQNVVFWKDVPGLLTADPRFIKEPKLVEFLSFQELHLLSTNGSEILHNRALEPLMLSKCEIIIANSNKYQERTLISIQENIKPHISVITTNYGSKETFHSSGKNCQIVIIGIEILILSQIVNQLLSLIQNRQITNYILGNNYCLLSVSESSLLEILEEVHKLCFK